MVTTIQISEKLHSELNGRKLTNSETYETVIWDLIEDTMELSEETKKGILISEKEIKAGKTHSLEEIKKELGL